MRNFLGDLDKTGDLIHVGREVSTTHEIAAVARKLDGKAVIFEKVKESRKYRVALGVCSTRGNLARALGVNPDLLLTRVLGAVGNPSPFRTTETAP